MSVKIILGILLAGILSNNYALLHFLGTGAVLENERSTARSLVLGLGTTAVMVVSTAITWALNSFVLEKVPYLQTMVFVLVVLCFGIWVLADFTAFWTAFHHMFFTNDLWLLDPRVDRMILICPEQLFFGIVVRFIGLFLAAALILCALSILCLRIRKKRTAPRVK